MRKPFLFIVIIILFIFCTSCMQNTIEAKESKKNTTSPTDSRSITASPSDGAGCLNIQAEIIEIEGVRRIIITLSETVDKNSIDENIGIYEDNVEIEAKYEITNEGKLIDFLCPDIKTMGELRIKQGLISISGAVTEEDYILEIPPLTTILNVKDIEKDTVQSIAIDFDMGLSSGYSAEYFIPPGIVTTTVNVYMLSNGDFLVNEIGGYRLTRLLADGSGKETFFQWHGPIFAFDIDANDNAYFYEGSLNNAENNGSIVKVKSNGEYEYLVKNSETINSDWDTGWLASAPDGTLYMITGRELQVEISLKG